MSQTSIPFFDLSLSFNIKLLYGVLRNAIRHASLLQTLILTFLSLYFMDTIYLVFIHPLRNVPGPRIAKFSQAWRNFRYFRGTWHSDVLNLHRQYGPVVRIAPNETNWYDTWIIPNMTVSFFAATDIKLHRHLRSRVSGAYSMTSILAMEPLVQDVADALWDRLRTLAEKEQPVALHLWAKYFAFDVVGQLALGGRIGFVQQGCDVDGIIASINDGFYLMANMGNVLGQMSWINNPLTQWAIRTLGGRRLNAFSVFLAWLEKRVDERMAGSGGGRRDMLQHFIDAKDTAGFPVTKADVMIEGVNILGAGADTTSIGILACLGALLQHPDCLRRAQAEVDCAYRDLGLERNSGDISFKDAERLPYLAAVIKESTRLHPSIQYQLPRYAPKGGVQIGEFFVREQTVCAINPVAMNRHKQIFGPDADHWRPERWIASSVEDEERIRHRTSLLTTFGMGSRSCVGKNLATVELFKFTAQFLRHFDAELLNPEKPWETKTQWFSMQSNFWIRLKTRDVSQIKNQC
ncbi:hypothetical protein PV09_09786 [Neofusicoccum parvum]|nr:hypothetical protein PV09_09786 [Neofusicoccum parvum]